MNLADAEREMAAFDAHTRARMREAAGDFKAAIQRSLRSPRRTITGRVLRWAQYGRWGVQLHEPRHPSIPLRFTPEFLEQRLGPALCARLLRLHGPRYLEHALLVGTVRPEPGTRIYIRRTSDLGGGAYERFLRSPLSLAEVAQLSQKPGAVIPAEELP